MEILVVVRGLCGQRAWKLSSLVVFILPAGGSPSVTSSADKVAS